jgi:hypothetical protein
MCQSWLRELLTPAPGTAARPDLLLRFGAQTLPCTIQQHILQLDPWLLSAHLCPCHHIPMQPSCASSSSSAAAAHAAATDAGSMAALLLLPEATPWSCSISGLPVMSPASSCPSDARILQLGRHTQLTLPCTAEAAAAWPAASKPAGSDASRRLRALQALPLAPGVPFEIEARLVTPPAAVDSMLLYGMPLLLTPAASTGGSSSAGCLGSEAAQDTDAAGFGPRDQQGQAVGVSASEAGKG